jgi:ribonuclease T2
MRRGDAAVISISAVLAVIVVAAVTFSIGVLDKTPSSAVFASGDTNSSWLVLTWGPSLCLVEATNSGCASGHVGAQGETFILHGLWPQPFENQYCNVDKDVAERAKDPRATDLPAIDIDADTRERLTELLSDASVMAPHEWYAHGTCAALTPTAYFSNAVALADQARAVLNPMFQAAQGKRLSATTLRQKFTDEFGEGAGDRVNLSCRNATGEGSVVYEVHVSLPEVTDLRTPKGDVSLANLILEAPPIAEGCRGGRVP